MDAEMAQFKIYLTRRYPDRSTTKHYMSDLTIFRQFVGEVSPRMITGKHLDQFVQAQSQQGLKAATINRRLSAISSFFDYLIETSEDDGWSNPVNWKWHSIRAGHHLPRDVKEETIKQLFELIHDSRDRAIFTLMLK